MVIFGKIAAAWLLVCLCHLLLQSQFTVYRHSPWKGVATYGTGWIILSAVSLLTDHIPVSFLAAAITAGMSCWYVSRAKPVKAIVFGLLFALLRLCAAGAALFLGQVFPEAGTACGILMEALVLFPLTACISALGWRWRNTPIYLLWLIPVWLVPVILCEEAIRYGGTAKALAPEFFALVWLFYAGVRLIHTCSVMEKKAHAYIQKQQIARHYVQQEEYYQQLLDKQTETRALWHDLNKYLRAAKAETPSAQALEQLESLLDSATGIVDVGNRVVNVILNEYAQAAKAAGIELRVKVTVPEELFVSAADLYVLIGNTMDNALEACKALPAHQRLIDLTLRTHNDVLYYKLVNPYSPQDSYPRNDPARGYGLQNVRKCVESYNGILDLVQEVGYFTVSAHLNCP